MTVSRGPSLARTVAAIAVAEELQTAVDQERQRVALLRRDLSLRAALLRPESVAWELPKR